MCAKLIILNDFTKLIIGITMGYRKICLFAYLNLKILKLKK